MSNVKIRPFILNPFRMVSNSETTGNLKASSAQVICQLIRNVPLQPFDNQVSDE
ncbi:MAG: hypothetical protein QOH31_6043 [Verrucomicrobiota bacterium]